MNNLEITKAAFNYFTSEESELKRDAAFTVREAYRRGFKRGAEMGVEVTYCKDCVYSFETNNRHCMLYKDTNGQAMEVSEKDYCSKGKREEDNENQT